MQVELSAAESRSLLTRLLGGNLPDEHGRFGPFGGRYAPETLVPALERLEAGVKRYLHDAEYTSELNRELEQWVGRPTPLTYAGGLSAHWGAEVYLKREDMAHTGAHKINNALGQALLAKRLGAKRVIAETGAGQHGVATAAACARVGIPCIVYMGSIDIERQAPNVDRMYQLGAQVVPVKSGDKTLRAAIDEAFRAWVADPEESYYLLGSVVGPHPYPYLVRELQRVIGVEARRQIVERSGRLPDVAIACIGGGSNAIGLFHPFLGDEQVELIGVEAGGRGMGLGDNSATLGTGTPGVLHGCYSQLLQDGDGQVQETHSISAGLDYPGVGPEHALLQAIGRVSYVSASDDEALAALHELCAAEGILPALESSHALVGARRWAKHHPGKNILIGLSGRGDKDMPTLSKEIQPQRAGMQHANSKSGIGA
jgi:tryptophan synthase beta chain